MSESELYRAIRRAPVAGTWREAGEEFRLTSREVEAEALWGAIEKVERRAPVSPAKERKAKNG